LEIVLGTYHLGLGGVESYTLTVAEQLQRLGHDVTIFGVQPGPASEVAQGRGVPLVVDAGGLPPRCDVLFAQDAIAAHTLVERYADTPLVFAAHAEEYDFCTPPQIAGFAQAVVVLHDRVARYVHSLAVVPEVVRMRQPVDAKRFYPRSPLNERPCRALVLGNWMQADRRRLLRDACDELGIDLLEHGAKSEYTRTPELELADVDIVFGKARVIVEAMASGRAAYVFDHNGGDGWVTPDRYALLESDNFGGQAEVTATTPGRLREDLGRYDQAMGTANRDLAVANHSASRHGRELVRLFAGLAPQVERPDAPVRELARVTRLQWETEGRAALLEAEVLRLRAQVREQPRPRIALHLRRRKDPRANSV
jgi:hypothetical protein